MPEKQLVLKTDFSLNQQFCQNEGNRLMISPLLAGMHWFCDKAGIFFKDINQRDEAKISSYNCKIFTRTIEQDEDMLIHENYFQNHPEIDIFIMCKIKGGMYDYLGYVTKKTVSETRIVEMIGETSDLASGKIRRIFADQYTHLNTIIAIMEEEQTEQAVITPQQFVPLHLHSEYCLPGYTYINCAIGTGIPISKLYSLQKSGKKLLEIYDGFGEIAVPNKIYKNSVQDVFEITTKDGKKIQASANHRFYTQRGWVKLKDLQTTDKLKTADRFDEISRRQKKDFAQGKMKFSEIANIRKVGKRQTYDIEMPKRHSFIAQNFVVHNSIGDGYGTCKQIAENLKAKGFKGAAITDHGTLAGIWEFQKALAEQNLKSIIGCEFYVKVTKDQEHSNHITILVKNDIGYKNLLKLQAIAVREGFYYRPVILLDQIFQHKEGLIIMSACSNGIIAKLIQEGKMELAQSIAVRFKQELNDDFYFEVMLHDIQGNQAVMQKQYELGIVLNIKSLLTLDSHYPNKEDRKYHEAVKAINYKKAYGEAGFGEDCFYIMTDEDINTKITYIPWLKPIISELKANTIEVFNKCSYMIQQAESQDTLPKLVADKQEQEKILKAMVFEGLAKYTKYQYEGVIKDRIDLELDRIISKGYTNYFLIVADMIRWAKQQGIRVGPGRGSVGASLVAYCLNITDIDPIEHDLLFDRFLSVIRKDMPDCDIDYQDNRRHEVFDYLKNKYGEIHCSKVITYSRFHGKGIMRDIGRIFKISVGEIEKVNSLIIERSGGDARASLSLTDTFLEFAEAKKFQALYPEATDIACKLEGAIRHKGVHAAAMAVTEQEINMLVPITKVGGELVTEWEKQMCEDAGLIKFDILGLNTLTIINDCLKTAKIELPKIFNDSKVYDTIFKTGKTLGVFQFNTTGITKLTQSLQPENFHTLYDATSLYRPGALHSGQTMQYVNRKTGKEQIEFLHPLLEPITKKSLGIILYQEDIMQIMHSVGGLSWATAESARKIMTKSKGKDAFNKIREEFVRNAKTLHNMPEEESNKLYDTVSTFGSYGFNKAHAVEYTAISYYCAWLKTYYPMHFYNALLKHEKDEAIIQEALTEAESLGFTCEYPDINKSEAQYTLVDNRIYAGFSAIIGIGNKVAEKIIKNRPYTSIADFKKRTKCSEKLFYALVMADCFRGFDTNRKRILIPTKQNTLLDIYANEGVMISMPAKDFTELEIAQAIIELTKLKPKMDIRQLYDFGKYNYIDIASITDKHADSIQHIRGICTAVYNKDKLLRHELKDHQFKFEEHMFYLNINDGTGNIAAQINPATYELYAEVIDKADKQPISILGRISKDGKKMYADILQLIGQHKTTAIDTLSKSIRSCSDEEYIIMSAQPAVSKNKKSYYRVMLHNKISGMVFQLTEKLYPGQKIKVLQHTPPFLKLDIIK